MPYQYTTFDGVDLPTYNPQTDLSSGAVDSALVDSIGGAFDVVGVGGLRLPRKATVTVNGVYVSDGPNYIVDHLGNFIVDHLGNFIVSGDAGADLRTQIDELYGKLGKRGRLYRTRFDDSSRQYKTARLLHVNHQRQLDDRLFKSTVTATFETTDAGWHENSLNIVTPSLIAGLTTFQVSMPGNCTVTDALLFFNATASVTSINVVGSGIDWTWNGTLASGDTLQIDCASQTIRAEGFDAYAYLTLNPNHTSSSWFPIAPGVNTYNVTANGTIDLEIFFHDQWI